MTRLLRVIAATGLFGSMACAEVVAIRMPGTDPHPQAFYTCEPQGTGFECDSAQSLHQYDRRLDPSAQKCENGFHQLHVETNWRGQVSSIQYQCALAPVGGFPAVAPNASTTAGGERGGH